MTKPFLKWAGGKRQILPDLFRHIPEQFDTYHEPFIGGGALFFALASRHEELPFLYQSDDFTAIISDINDKLIDTYIAVRDDVDAVIDLLKQYKKEELQYEKCRDYFYIIRDQDILSQVEIAARFIYITKTGFNGLYRENHAGKCNVSYGGNHFECDLDNLRLVSDTLKNVEILCTDFSTITDRVQSGDFVYLDPPYIPISNTSNFTGYTKHGFGMDQQIQLRNIVDELTRMGVYVLLSNSDTGKTREIYKEYIIETISVRRTVSGDGDKRGFVNEVLVKNF